MPLNANVLYQIIPLLKTDGLHNFQNKKKEKIIFHICLLILSYLYLILFLSLSYLIWSNLSLVLIMFSYLIYFHLIQFGLVSYLSSLITYHLCSINLTTYHGRFWKATTKFCILFRWQVPTECMPLFV
jgi:hypothetical protein